MAAGLLAATPAMADEPAAEPQQQLRTSAVHVTASRVDKELLQVPMSVSVLTAEDIRKSTARTIGELIQDIPGVNIVNSGGQGLKRVSIRGESPNRVLILIDGQKIAENKSMDGTPLLIDPSRIERVEVIRGPASVLYGSEALGGVVNIITKKGGDTPVAGEAGLSFNGASEGFGEYLSVFGGLKGFKYRLSGSHNAQGDYRSANGRVPNTSFRQTDASAFVSYDFEKLTLGGGADIFDSAVKSGSQLPGYENFSVDIPAWKREKYYGFAEFKDLADWMPRLRLDVFHQTNDKHMYNHVDTDAAVTLMPFVVHNEADNENKQLGASVQADWQIGDNHYLITGYEYNRDKLDATTRARTETSLSRVIAMGVPNTPVAPFPGAPTIAQMMYASLDPYTSLAYHKGTQQTHAVFAQMESDLPHDFTLNYGARYTWVRSKMSTARGWRTSTATGNVTSTDVGVEETSSDSHPVFNLGLIWSGIDNLSLRATFAQGFRSPSLQERYVMSSMGGGTVYPNPDLDPETSDTYEIGARYADHGFVLDATVFYSVADDYIATQRINSNASEYQNINVGSAKTHGLELFASYDLPYGFTPYVSGAWTRRKYDYGHKTTWKSGVPELTGRAGLRFSKDVSPEARLNLDGYLRFNSPWEEESEAGVLTRCNHWETANFAANLDFGKEKEYTVGLEVLNIFNTSYQLSQGLEEPGMHVNMKFSMRF